MPITEFYPTRLLFGTVLVVLAVAGCSNSNSERSDHDGSPRAETEKPTPHELPRKNDSSIPELYVEFEYSSSSDPSLRHEFLDLRPDQTGVDLVHVWDPPPIHRSYVSQIFGTGVALGDYDNDGLLDVFVANQTDAGRLYRSLGNMRFEDVTRSIGIDPAGMWTFGAGFVDINGDGLLDLHLCGQDCPNRLYINTGNGFEERAAEFGLDFHGASIEMTFADYDLDGDLDGYLVTNHQEVIL